LYHCAFANAAVINLLTPPPVRQLSHCSSVVNFTL